MTATGEPSRLAVEVRFDVEPIEGRVCEDGGELNRPFSGWLGLMAAIEAARPTDPRPPDERNGGPR
jgi:hypothetical protein